MKKIIILALIPFLLITCEKKDLKIYKLEITSEEVVTTITTAEITAQYNYPAKLEHVDCFVSPTEDMENTVLVVAEISDKQFVIQLDSLIVNTQYYYSYEYSNGIDIKRTDVKSFTTKDYDLPTVTTSTVTNITAVSAKCGGNVTYDGGTNVIARGVCWGRSPNPTISGSHTTNGIGTGSFTSDLTELATNTQYYVRAYATTSKGTSYGTQMTFTTMEGLPTVTTSDITNITATSARCGGNVTDDGWYEITARGVCWSTNQNPTINDAHTTNGTGTGIFTSNLTGLVKDTKYYVRAYATNNIGTSYGAQKEFTTMDGLITVTTSDVTNITGNSATCGGSITDGGMEITARGVCWSTNSNPTINDSYTSDGTGIGTFISSITGLSIDTRYYIRAYAITSEGINYGELKEFYTTDGLPIIATNDVTNITTVSAICGGVVSSDGGFEVTARGICWSTSQYPTIDDPHSTDGVGVGDFTSNLTDLNIHTKYYVRAYATNSIGTSYGEEKSFTTMFNAPQGAINSLFSVSDSKQVCFSQGNLQYKASTNTWRFAINQYDYIGDNNQNISSSYPDWIDLFGWGTSGYNHGAVCYQPWSTSQTDRDYLAYGNTYNLYDQSGKADWGYNSISNGGNVENQWRTLTRDEWTYILNTRSTSSGIRYVKARVNGINGLILLPDDWGSSLYSFSNSNNGGAYFNSNTISLSDWATILEANGAVFLPAAGRRLGTVIDNVGSIGYYWSATYYSTYYGSDNGPYIAWFGGDYIYVNRHVYPSYGLSVRLVHDAN